MMIKEARWIGANLDQIDARSLSPMLNIGSSTHEFRNIVQPWINDHIFDRLHARGVDVVHLDLLPGEGVDIVGDITNHETVDRLVRQQFKSVICSNVLEHVRDVGAVCSVIEKIAPEASHIVVTVPYRYPYHPDPIDLMFRPDLAQLIALFPESSCVRGDIVDCGSFRDYLWHTIVVAVPWGIRHASGVDKRPLVRAVGSYFTSLFADWQVTCVVLKKATRVHSSPTARPDESLQLYATSTNRRQRVASVGGVRAD